MMGCLPLLTGDLMMRGLDEVVKPYSEQVIATNGGDVLRNADVRAFKKQLAAKGKI